MSKKFKFCIGFPPMIMAGAFPMAPVPPIAFAPFMPVFENQNGSREAKNLQKEECKSLMKDFWLQMTEMQKASLENARELWNQTFAGMMEMQDAFAASLPEDVSSLPFAQLMPIPPKAYMQRMKDFQEMANAHFVEQVDSFMDFCAQGQQQFFDFVVVFVKGVAAKVKEAAEKKEAAEEKDAAAEVEVVVETEVVDETEAADDK